MVDLKLFILAVGISSTRRIQMGFRHLDFPISLGVGLLGLPVWEMSTGMDMSTWS